MKPIFLALALPLLLGGCATYVGDYGPGYPGYYDGYYYGGPAVDVGLYSYDRGGYYHHDYHHYDTASHGTVAYHGASHVSGHAFAGVSHVGGHSGGGGGRSASVSMGHR